MANLVASTPYAIGYSVLNEAVYRQLTFASVQNAAGSFVLGSPAAVQYALYERAVLTLGLTNTDILPGPSGNSISLINPSAPRAYPISGFSYLIVFTNSTRANQSCAARQALVQFILFLIYSDVVATLAQQSEFNSVPPLLQQALNMEQIIASSIRCPDGSLAYIAPTASSSSVSGSGSPAVQSFFNFFTASYASVDGSVAFSYTATSSTAGLYQLRTAAAKADFASFAVGLDVPSGSEDEDVLSNSSPDVQSLPLALLPVVPVFHLPGLTSLTLSVAVIGSMFSGVILQWNDSAIRALNPTIALPATPILLTAVASTAAAAAGSPLEGTSIFVDTLFRLSPAFAACYANNVSTHNRQFDFASAALPGCSGYPNTRWQYVASEGSIQSVVSNTVGALGFTLTGFTIQATAIAILPPDAVNSTAAVSFNISQLDLCLTRGGYSVSAETGQLEVVPSLSTHPQCWPFTGVLSLLTLSAYTSVLSVSTSTSADAVSDASLCSQARHLLAFIDFLYSPAASRVLTSAASSNGLALIAAQNSPILTVASDVSASLARSWTCDGALVVVTTPAPVTWVLAESIRISGETLAALGYATTLVAMALIYFRRQQTAVKVASPVFIWLSLMGLLCLYTALLLLVQPVTATSCSGLNWSYNLGFTLTLAPLLVKAWRVHRIFNRRKMRVVKISNSQLLLVVGALLTMETGLLIAWQAVAPMSPSTISQQESNVQHLYTQCAYTGSSIGFFAAAGLSKGLMLVMGVLLAFNTRDVAQQFNESKSIAIAIYNIVIVLALIAPIIVFIAAAGDTLVTLLLFLLAWAATFTLISLMLPKLLSLLSHRSRAGETVFSMNTVAPSPTNGSAMVGGESGGLFDFPSISDLSSRPTLLQYITALEQQHALAKRKLHVMKEDAVQHGGPGVGSPLSSPMRTIGTRGAASSSSFRAQPRLHVTAEAQPHKSDIALRSPSTVSAPRTGETLRPQSPDGGEVVPALSPTQAAVDLRS